MKKKIVETTKDYFFDLINAVVKEDFFGTAAEMAYMLTLSIFPLALLIMAVLSIIGRTSIAHKIFLILHQFAPSEAVNLIEKVINEVTILKGSFIFVVLGFLTTLFLASNAINALIKGLNKSNKIKENRSFIHIRTLCVVMVFVQVFFLFFSIDLIILGRTIVNLISNYIQIIPPWLYETILFLRWPVAFLLLFILALINYYYLPAFDYSKERKSVIPGALFFTIFWLFGSWIFSIYINNFGAYNKVYGTLGAFAILMVWLYFTSIIILIGGEINNYTFNKMNKS